MGLVILDDPIRAIDDRFDCSTEFLALHHLHIYDLCIRRDAEGRSGDRTGDGGAMRITDLRIIREAREARANTAGELRMISGHAAVEHIDGDTATGARVTIRAIERRTPLVDPIERE